ncbi:formylglycine-generating enzyme family protein [Salinicoccus hispanicus]|uniref:SUMF1/EgtB/PvdO family nonheme iron enzyme n=1 Tax=Salinicoccus hispanicus TaxID=157225 RepID=A0A6N8U0S5_9STAP|nr:formylglycine-generating enzyme family protein [Salinicoccus hispanicus]MXQ49935.1 SUMF1/EgtB/PvdO family nonheme iron enzyme [Salinicoccus hispanicus]
MDTKKNCCAVSRATIEAGGNMEAPVGLKNDGHAVHAEDMVLIPGGEFLMGTDDPDANPEDNEGPVRRREVSSFLIDKYTVTNRQFEEFVNATDYRTDAEKFKWSFVFHLFLSEAAAQAVTQAPMGTPWWRVVEGADWRHPEGPDSSIDQRMDHPVVHVSWNDAMAYCKWSGRRLLTETEWEYAARGGLEQNRYPWGNELMPDGVHHCNIWQGHFPEVNFESDGYAGTAPVNAYQPNGYNLYNMSGNVWEWCSDTFYKSAQDPAFHLTAQPRSMRGGSYLCHESYCNRYRVAARTSNTPDSSTGNTGFRCAMDA